MLLDIGVGGFVMYVVFSFDSKRIVFMSNWVGVLVEFIFFFYVY